MNHADVPGPRGLTMHHIEMHQNPARVRPLWRYQKGGKKPEDVVYVGRPGRWGNPYRVGHEARDNAEAVAMFESNCAHLKEAAARELKGKRLACWCRPDEPCHGDVLLKWANED